MTPADYETTTYYWPENERAVGLFYSLMTQWRTVLASHGGGVVSKLLGLDYNVAFTLMGRMRLTDQEFDDLFSDLQVLEEKAKSIVNNRA